MNLYSPNVDVIAEITFVNKFSIKIYVRTCTCSFHDLSLYISLYISADASFCRPVTISPGFIGGEIWEVTPIP